MGPVHSKFDIGRLDAALSSSPRRFQIHQGRLDVQRDKARSEVRRNVEFKPKTVWTDAAMFAAREHYIVRARHTALLKLMSHCKFLMGALESMKVGDLPPAGTKPSMDTVVWASRQCPEIDELAVVAEELMRRYGAHRFRAAVEYSQGHEVDSEVWLRLGHTSANPSSALVQQEVIDIAAEAPALSLNPYDLTSAIGSTGPSLPPPLPPLPQLQQQQQQSPQGGSQEHFGGGGFVAGGGGGGGYPSPPGAGGEGGGGYAYPAPYPAPPGPGSDGVSKVSHSGV